MLHLTIGSDTYGRVKNVGRTPIVTKFQMVNAVPIWPLQSFYWIGPGETKREGVPFLASIETAEIVGLPLARRDKLSVGMAYLRGVAATLTVIGSIVIVPGIMHLTGERLDRFAMQATYLLLTMLGTGVTVGALSYCWPFQVSERERQIRTACGQALGVCADPAMLTREAALWVVEQCQRIQSTDQAIGPAELHVHELVRVRAKIALGEPREHLESVTDGLLVQVAAKA